MDEESERDRKGKRIQECSNLSSNFEEIFNDDRLVLAVRPPPSTIPIPPNHPSYLHQPFDADADPPYLLHQTFKRIGERSNLSSRFEEFSNEERLALTLRPPSTIPTPPSHPSYLHQPFDADADPLYLLHQPFKRIGECSNLSSRFEEFSNENRLALTLRPPSTIPTPPPSPDPPLQPPPPPPHPPYLHQPFDADPPHQEHNPLQSNENTDIIEPPYQWATNHHAKIHDLGYLLSKNIKTIQGEVKCKKCNHTCAIGFHLENKFRDIASFIRQNKRRMNNQAPKCWTNPKLPNCTQEDCNEPNSLKPVIPTDEQSINWLFLLLGQMLGCCTLQQLKYFCRHTNNCQSGLKAQVLYLTYLNLCKQLDERGPFDVSRRRRRRRRRDLD